MLSLPSALPPQALQPDESVRAQQLHTQLTAGGRKAGGKPQDIKSAAAELSSLFVAQMLQAMRRTVPKSGLLDTGFAHETYVSLFDQEIARQVAQREDFAFTAMLLRQLQRPDADSQVPVRPAARSPQSAVLQAYRQQATPPDSMFIMPVAGQETASFGRRIHPLEHAERQHDGMDIAAPAGTPVHAAAGGQVVFSGTQPGYGNTVVIQHAEGYSTIYAHTAANLVSVGTAVSQGQPIATVGSTGQTTGPHLHFEVRKHGQPLNPAPLLEMGNAKKMPLKFLMAAADTKAIQ